jgi:HJR/Mrr/RecB family endonuclease
MIEEDWMSENDPWRRGLRNAVASQLRAPVLNANYILQFVCTPSSPLSDFMLYDVAPSVNRGVLRQAIITSSVKPEIASALVQYGWETHTVQGNQTVEFLLVDNKVLYVVSIASGSHGPGVHIRQVEDYAEIRAALKVVEDLRLKAGVSLDYQSISNLALPETESKLILVSDTSFRELLQQLSQNPSEMLKIHPRQFEELVAGLLDKQGFDVQLTPQTRDGGRDVLAFQSTPAGKLLFLVECKQFRPDRPVGVSIVRALYGVVELERANAGMIVTTSTFSPDAVDLARKISYRMKLKEYSDVVDWIKKVTR